MAIHAGISFDSYPTSENLNSPLVGILPVGLYSGGAVTPGPSLSVRVEPFVARSNNLTVWSDDWESIDIGSSGIFYLVLQATHVPSTPTEPQWLVLPYASYLIRPDLENLIVFARITIPSGSSIILPEYIDSSEANRRSLDLNTFFNRVYTGTVNLDGQSGSLVYHGLGHKNYTVSITPSEIPNSGLGDIYVLKDYNSFTIYITGLATTKVDYQLINNRPLPTFGPVGTLISQLRTTGSPGFLYPHNFGTVDHHAIIVDESNTPGNAGNIWVELGNNNDTVGNDGALTRTSGAWLNLNQTNSFYFGHANFTAVGMVAGVGNTGTGDVFPGTDSAYLGPFPNTYTFTISNKSGSNFRLSWTSTSSTSGYVDISNSNYQNVVIEYGLTLSFILLSNFQNGDVFTYDISPTTITHNLNLNASSYMVHILPIANPAGLNNWWVTKQTNSIKVWQDGAAVTEFQYLIVLALGQFVNGTGTVSAATGNTISHYLNRIDYVPMICPTSNLGRFSVLRGYNIFEIFPQRYSNLSFEWMVVPQRVFN